MADLHGIKITDELKLLSPGNNPVRTERYVSVLTECYSLSMLGLLDPSFCVPAFFHVSDCLFFLT